MCENCAGHGDAMIRGDDGSIVEMEDARVASACRRMRAALVDLPAEAGSHTRLIHELSDSRPSLQVLIRWVGLQT
jgi:hypothetical protein